MVFLGEQSSMKASTNDKLSASKLHVKGSFHWCLSGYGRYDISVNYCTKKSTSYDTYLTCKFVKVKSR